MFKITFLQQIKILIFICLCFGVRIVPKARNKWWLKKILGSITCLCSCATILSYYFAFKDHALSENYITKYLFTQSIIESVYHAMFPFFSIFILMLFWWHGEDIYRFLTRLHIYVIPTRSTFVLFFFLLLNQFLLSQLQLLGYIKYYSEILWDIKTPTWLTYILFYGFASAIFASVLPTTLYIFTTELLAHRFQINNRKLSQTLWQIVGLNSGAKNYPDEVFCNLNIIHGLNKEHKRTYQCFQDFVFKTSWALFASNTTISFSIFACLVYTVCQQVPLPTLYLTIMNNISLYICLYLQGKVTDDLIEQASIPVQIANEVQFRILENDMSTSLTAADSERQCVHRRLKEELENLSNVSIQSLKASPGGFYNISRFNVLSLLNGLSTYMIVFVQFYNAERQTLSCSSNATQNVQEN